MQFLGCALEPSHRRAGLIAQQAKIFALQACSPAGLGQCGLKERGVSTQHTHDVRRVTPVLFRGEYLSPLSKRDSTGVARREQRHCLDCALDPSHRRAGLIAQKAKIFALQACSPAGLGQRRLKERGVSTQHTHDVRRVTSVLFRGEYLSPLSKRDSGGVARREQRHIREGIALACGIQPARWRISTFGMIRACLETL
jgi:DNA-binding transcriptional regulator YdaS (Cro superfamily)